MTTNSCLTTHTPASVPPPCGLPAFDPLRVRGARLRLRRALRRRRRAPAAVLAMTAATLAAAGAAGADDPAPPPPPRPPGPLPGRRVCRSCRRRFGSPTRRPCGCCGPATGWT
ncbi:hypothetical protein AB6O49_14025 [Streptomyces sp. SBR177]